jgi:hypothetical protein
MQDSQGHRKRIRNSEQSRNLFWILGKRKEGKLTEGFLRALVNKLTPTLPVIFDFLCNFFLDITLTEFLHINLDRSQ